MVTSVSNWEYALVVDQDKLINLYKKLFQKNSFFYLPTTHRLILHPANFF